MSLQESLKEVVERQWSTAAVDLERRSEQDTLLAVVVFDRWSAEASLGSVAAGPHLRTLGV